MKMLVTGAAGFIGFSLLKSLLPDRVEIVGLDNINDYYDTTLKYNRLNEIGIDKSSISYGNVSTSKFHPNFKFIKMDLADREGIGTLFEGQRFDLVCHLAAQAGVRYSIENPYAYIDSNINGFIHVLEGCRHHRVGHLVYASSSSVYGMNRKMPFSTSDNVDHPVSLYAATKKSNELMAHAYSNLYGLPTTGLRFFTVYGPWGRPDMAYYKFAKNIMAGKVIDVYNDGNMSRDFTYIDDIVQGLLMVIRGAVPAGDPKWDGNAPDPSASPTPFKVYNIGNNTPEKLLDFIRILETHLNKKAVMNLMPMQAGDVEATWADIDPLQTEFEYQPSTSLDQGISRFVSWFKAYYNLDD